MKKIYKKTEVAGSENGKKKVSKKHYVRPAIEEHDTLDKASGCSVLSTSYISGYGYYH